MGANPVDRAKAGSKLHLAVDGGLPLLLLVTTATSNDRLVLEALLDDLPEGSRCASPGLGRHRCKAERSIAWLAGCRRLRVRYDWDSERFFAFAMLACVRLGYNRLPGTVDAHARSP